VSRFVRTARLLLIVVLLIIASYMAGILTVHVLCALASFSFCPMAPQDVLPRSGEGVELNRVRNGQLMARATAALMSPSTFDPM
jgi:hypothetical protein